MSNSHVIGIVEHRGFQRLERRRVVGAFRHGVGSGLRARMPDVEFERPGLREPQQRRQVVAQQIIVPLVLVPREHRDGLDELRPLLLPVLLEKPLPPDAVGHADHRERAIGEMRQHVGRNLREVAQQVALGERRLLERRIRGPVDAIEVRKADPVRAHRERERGLPVFQLRHDIVDRTARGRRTGPRAAPGAGSARRTAFGSMSSRSRRNTGARRCIVVGPALEAHFGDDFGLDPGRRTVELRLLGEWAGAFAAADPVAP